MEYNSPLVGILLANLVLIGTNFTGRCNFNYHAFLSAVGYQSSLIHFN